MNSYKDSAEWQALNKIWKSLPKDYQTKLSEDFKLISGFIEKNQYRYTFRSSVLWVAIA